MANKINYTAIDTPLNVMDLINYYADQYSYSFSITLFKEFKEKTMDNGEFRTNYLLSKFYDCYKMLEERKIEFSTYKISSYKEIYMSLIALAADGLDSFLLFLSQIPDDATFISILSNTKPITNYIDSLEIDDQFAIQKLCITQCIRADNFGNIKKLTISKPDLKCTVPAGVTNVYAEKLKELDISKADKSAIGPAMLYSSLEKIKLPETLERIPNFAFDGRKALKEINIPKNVTQIGINAFNGCADDLKIEVSKKSDILVPDSDLNYLKQHIVWKK